MTATISMGNKSALKQVLKGWLFAGLVSLVAIVFYIFFAFYGNTQAALSALCFFLGLGLIVFWRTQDWKYAAVDGFGSAVLGFMALYKLFSALDFAFIGIRYESWPTSLPMEPSFEQLVFKGELVTQVGVLAFSGFWRIFMGNAVSVPGFLNSYMAMPAKTLWTVFIAAVFCRLADRLLGAEFGPLTSLFVAVYGFGIASIYFISDRQKRSILKVGFALMLGLPLFLLSLSAGMKEELIVPLIPAGLHAFRACKGLISKMFVVIIVFLAMSIMQSFVSVVRETSWANEESTPVTELTEIFFERFSTEYLSDSANHLLSRINMSNMHAVTVAVEQANGRYFTEIIGSIPAAFIPRIIWPDKPFVKPGAQHTQRIWGIWVDQNENITSTSAGFFTELYLAGGFFVVVSGAFLLAMMHAGMCRYFITNKMNFSLFIFSFSYFIIAMRFDETHVVYAFTGLISFFIIINAINYIVHVFGEKSKRVL